MVCQAGSPAARQRICPAIPMKILQFAFAMSLRTLKNGAKRGCDVSTPCHGAAPLRRQAPFCRRSKGRTGFPHRIPLQIKTISGDPKRQNIGGRRTNRWKSFAKSAGSYAFEGQAAAPLFGFRLAGDARPKGEFNLYFLLLVNRVLHLSLVQVPHEFTSQFRLSLRR